MDVNISVFKDLGEVLKAASEAIGEFIKAITSAASSATQAYNDLAARRERRDLVNLSARLTNLGSEFNNPVVRSIEEYIAQEQPTILDWQAVQHGFQGAIEEVASILTNVKNERSEFVLHPAYAQLSAGLHTRAQLLEKLAHMEPPTEPEELQALNTIREQYNLLITQLREAVRALNTYLGEEYYNNLNDLSDWDLMIYMNRYNG
jgi:hypothetical protein